MISLVLHAGTRKICVIQHRFIGLDLYYADPAQDLTVTILDLDDVDCHISDLSVRRVRRVKG